MRTLFSGQASVHYGQIYVESGGQSVGDDMQACFTGQSSGLCGAATPGGLFLITGLHTGAVEFAVERHDESPPVDELWQEIVEVSFAPATVPIALVQWADEASWPLDLDQVQYRVRYCASGMDEANAKDTRLEGEPAVDRYLLQFWPGAPEPDRVVKQTSAIAAYWHGFAQGLPWRSASRPVG